MKGGKLKTQIMKHGIFKKISALTLGAAMALGVGVAVSSVARGTVKEGKASTTNGSYALTFDLNTSSDGTGTSSSGDSSATFTAATFMSSGTNTYTVSKVSYYWLCSGYDDLADVTVISNVYPGKNSSIKVGKGKGDGVLNFTVNNIGTASQHFEISSVVITAYGTGTAALITVDEANEETKSQSMTTSESTYTFTYDDNNCDTVSITGGAGLSSSNKVVYITSITINYTLSDISSVVVDTSSATSTTFLKDSTFDATTAASNNIKATATYEDGYSLDVTSSATWNLDTSTAGTAPLSATYGGTTSDGVNVTITASSIAVESVTLSTNSLTVKIAYTSELTVSVLPNDASDKTITWSSDDETIASVSSSGVVTGVGVGSTYINAEANDGSGCFDICEVTVTAANTYSKVTAELDDYRGTYLIVNEDSAVAFDGSLTTLDVTQNNIPVSISSSTITGSPTIDASVFSFIRYESSYLIKSASGYYIGRSTNSNGIDSSADITGSEADYVNTIAIDGGMLLLHLLVQKHYLIILIPDKKDLDI